MIEFRCTRCNRLLAKIDGNAKVEIKCPRCKTMNLFTEEIFITIEAKESSFAEASSFDKSTEDKTEDKEERAKDKE